MAGQRRVCLWFWMQSSMAAHRGGVGLSFPAVSFLFAAMCACCLFVPRRGDYISGTANTRVLIKLLFRFYGFSGRARLLVARSSGRAHWSESEPVRPIRGYGLLCIEYVPLCIHTLETLIKCIQPLTAFRFASRLRRPPILSCCD